MFTGFPPSRLRRLRNSPRWSAAFRYGMAVVLCLAALGVNWAIPLLETQSPGVVFLAVVVMAALYGGLGPALLATAVSALMLDLIALPASGAIPSAFPDVLRIGVFLGLAILISSLSSRRRRAEKTLRLREQHYRGLIENSSDVLTILSPRGEILYQSPSVERVLGYDPAQMLGSDAFQYVHPEDLDRVRKIFQQSLGQPGVTEPVELRFRARDGSFKTLECVGNNLLHEPSIAGVVVHSRDISERKELQREQAARRRYHELVEGLEAVVWEADAGRFTFVSQRAEQILGYPLQLWLKPGEEWLRHVIPEDRDTVRRAFLQSGTDTADIEYRAVTANGRLRWLRLIIYRARGEHAATQARGLIVDVTERREAEAALRRSEQQAATGRLAASIAHEINNPMAAVTNLLFLLQKHPSLDLVAQQYARMAEQELHRMAHITRQMLGFYREASAPVAVNLASVLDDVLELYSRRIAGSGAEVEKRYDPAPPIEVLPGEMRQVFSNLLLNAVDAVGPEGRIWLHVFPSRDWKNPSRTGIRVVFADNGPGIRPEYRQQIFEPFFTTKGQNGTGLGLWVCRGIVQKHNGSIRVRSGYGRASGTSFSIFLPYGGPDDAGQADGAAGAA